MLKIQYKVLLHILINSVLFFAIYGQDVLEIKKDTSERNHALELQILNEQSLTYRYNLSNQSHFKVGLDFTANFSEYDLYTDNTLYSLVKDKNYGVRINSQIFFKIYDSPFIDFNIGIGPTFYYGRNISNWIYHDLEGAYLNTTRTIAEIGLMNTINSEFHLTDELFVLFKFDYYLKYGKEVIEVKQNKIRMTSIEERDNYFELSLSKFKIGFGFRF